MLFEGHIETINFQENVDLQVTLVSTPALEAERFTFRCKCTAEDASTAGFAANAQPSAQREAALFRQAQHEPRPTDCS
jgi:hypothetical protein